MNDYYKYTDFDENDFINDPYFQDWVINSNTANRRFWETFFETYPHKKEPGEIARNFLKNISFKEHLPDESLIKRSLAKHLRDIERFEANKVIHIQTKFPLQNLLRIGAIIGGVLLIISALLVIGKKDEAILVKTAYGNMKSVLLPDSSLVVLNANSTVTFSRKWNKSNSREVWLQGEAFFDVRHINVDSSDIQKYEQFIVHTDHLAVEVLGTSFDIRQRRGKTEVVLQTGKIKVSFKDKRSNDIIMNPGEIVAYNPGDNNLVKATTSAEDFSAWKEKRLILNDPTAAEIVEYLEDNFGKDIMLEDTALAKRKIEGPILLTNLDDALFILSTVLNTEIIRKDSTIIIRPR